MQAQPGVRQLALLAQQAYLLSSTDSHSRDATAGAYESGKSRTLSTPQALHAQEVTQALHVHALLNNRKL